MAEEIRDVEVDDERHPIRFIVKLAAFVGVLYTAGRFLAQKKNEYADLTESQARDKIVEKMTPRVGDETANEIAEQVIPKLKKRGLIKADPMEEAADDIAAAADEAVKAMDEGVEKAADKVADAVDSVVKE
jgi:hypothetical protein